MSMLSRIIFLCVGINVVKSEAVSYCDPAICPPGLTHVACNHDIIWSSNCSEDAVFVEFTRELQRIVLDAHNKLRNQIALGELHGYPTASRMATVTWDDELAELAKYNTMQCQMIYDECHSTRLFWMTGQNLAELAGDVDDTYTAAFGPNHWLKENSANSLNNIRHFRDFRIDGKWVGHFTQLVKDDSFKLGCSISKYTVSDEGKKSLLACNYAVGNLLWFSNIQRRRNSKRLYEWNESKISRSM